MFGDETVAETVTRKTMTIAGQAGRSVLVLHVAIFLGDQRFLQDDFDLLVDLRFVARELGTSRPASWCSSCSTHREPCACQSAFAVLVLGCFD